LSSNLATIIAIYINYRTVNATKNNCKIVDYRFATKSFAIIIDRSLLVYVKLTCNYLSILENFLVD